jgi:hypothetical protein
MKITGIARYLRQGWGRKHESRSRASQQKTCKYVFHYSMPPKHVGATTVEIVVRSSSGGNNPNFSILIWITGR